MNTVLFAVRYYFAHLASDRGVKYCSEYLVCLFVVSFITQQEGLAVASIAWDDPSTLLGDDSFPRTRMHCEHHRRGWSHSNFTVNFCVRKLKSRAYHVALFAWSTFSRFDTIAACDRHTHRWTVRQMDRHTTTAYTALSIASRSKNGFSFWL